MIIRCVALDDEPRALEVLQSHAARTSFLKLEETFVDPFQAIEYINAEAISLVFLDINMPDINGLKVLTHFKNQPLVIFTTAHSEYAIESYEVDALDYLLKPFDYSRFFKAVSKARHRLEADVKPAPGILFVNTGSKQERIVLDKLLYVESEGNYVRYVTQANSYLVRATVKETIGQLPASQFVQVHRSFIVAIRCVERIEDNYLFIGKKSIPLGATYKQSFSHLIGRLKG